VNSSKIKKNNLLVKRKTLTNGKRIVYSVFMKWEKRPEIRCKRCGKSWRPYKPSKEIRQCPYCKSAYWDVLPDKPKSQPDASCEPTDTHLKGIE
jgi:Zn finger protein HypA/HybF involved in hydrogenase expression